MAVVADGGRRLGSLSAAGARRNGRIGPASLIVLVGAAVPVLALCLYFPVAGFVVVMLYAASRLRSSWPLALTVVVILTGLFAWMNTRKNMLGDWIWYTDHFRLLTVRSFADYLGEQVPPFTIKSSEPVYYAVAFVTARITGGNVALLALVVTALVYAPVGLAAALVARRALRDSPWVGLAIGVAMLTGVTFTVTTQLIRQEIGGALLLLGFVLLHDRKRWLGTTVLLLALLCHNSVAIPFAAVAAARLLGAGRGGSAWLPAAIAGPVFLVGGFVYTRLPGSEGYAAVLKNDGSISALVFVLDLVLFSAFLIARRWMGPLTGLHASLTGAVAIYTCFLVGVSSAPVPFLRMYLHLEMARVVVITCLIVVAARARSAIFLPIPLGVAAVMYVELRLASSPFDYGGGFISHLLTPLTFGPAIT